MNRPLYYTIRLRRSTTLLSHKRALSSTGSLWRYRKNVTVKESYYHGSSHIPLLGKTIGVALQESAEKFPHQDAFVHVATGTRHTYSQLLEEVDRVAAGFIDIGITKGDRVGMWGPNIEEWVLTLYATARIGAILVSVNPAYRVHELEYAIHKVGMKAIVAPQSYKTQKYYGMLSELCPELKTSKPGELHSERLPSLRTVIIAGSDNLGGALKFDDVRDMGREKRHEIEKLCRDLEFDEPINIIFTSGTTGQPKGATQTHHNILNNAYLGGLMQKFDMEKAVVCQTLPMYHVGGTVGCVSAMLHGVTSVFPAPGPDIQKTLQAIETEKCTIFYGTPTIYVDLFNHPDFDKHDTSSLKIGCIGASPCPPELLKRLKGEMNMSPLVFYGLTETTGVTTATVVGDPDNVLLHTVGKAADHLEIKIVDPQTKKIVPVNQRGEICTRGFSVMKGYWNDPEQTAETIDEDGWLHSGDLAVMHENGYCSIVGRIKDMIIRGGSNLFPAEIENFLHEHPKVANVQVVGVPDERMGEEICACIQLKDGETCTLEEIKEFCKGQISHNKIPRYVEFVDSYPMTVTMKVQKFELARIMKERLRL